MYDPWFVSIPIICRRASLAWTTLSLIDEHAGDIFSAALSKPACRVQGLLLNTCAELYGVWQEAELLATQQLANLLGSLPDPAATVMACSQVSVGPTCLTSILCRHAASEHCFYSMLSLAAAGGICFLTVLSCENSHHLRRFSAVPSMR